MLASLAKQMIVDGLVQRASHQAAAQGKGMGLYVLAGGLGVIGIIFLSISLYGVLLGHFSMPVAAACTGGGAIVLALGAAFSGKYVAGRRNQKRTVAERESINALVDSLCDEMLSECQEPIRENPKTALLIAGLAGLVAGEHLH